MDNDIQKVSEALLFPPEGFVFDTYTEIQREFINKVHAEGIKAALLYLEAVKEDTERSYPEVLTLKWEGTASAYIVELSEEPAFSDAFKIECKTPFCEITNLKVGQTYYWRVNGGEARSFSTKKADFRFIKVDGVLNVRDIGGNKIKQGMIYRGSDIYTRYKITEKGKDTMLNTLKIKTEVEHRIEFRDAGPSALGEAVAFKDLPYRPYKEIFEQQHREEICTIMEFLADEKNYPMYIHCLGGADRTGMIAIYLRALLGEEDEIIHTDYELTSLSTYAYGMGEGVSAKGYRSREKSYYIEFLDLLDAYAPGESLAVKVPLFLAECGVSQECMDKIRRILGC